MISERMLTMNSPVSGGKAPIFTAAAGMRDLRDHCRKLRKPRHFAVVTFLECFDFVDVLHHQTDIVEAL